MFRRAHAWVYPLISLAFVALGAAGCAPEKPAEDKADERPRGPSELKLLVVDDPAMAAAIGELRAEWKARTGSALEIAGATTAELLDGAALPAGVQAVIYPSAQLGPLAERGWIAPLPEGYSADRELNWGDTFELLQVAETRWGDVPHAIPFGSPVLTLYYRADLLAHLHKRPPATWKEYRDLAEVLSQRENLGDAAPPADAPWSGTAEPLAAGWAAGALLARAAPLAKHRDHYSALFDIDSMEPLVGGPPFVRALEELAADAKLGPADPLELDPAAVRRAFVAGQTAMALTWPGHAGLRPEPGGAEPPPTGFAELPGSDDVYNVSLKSWEKRPRDESPHVPLLGLAGRLGSVTPTEQQAAAFRLLVWLAGREWGPKVSSASPATTLYRDSQLKAPQPWLDPLTDSEAAEQYATSLHDAQSRLSYLYALRIPGRQRYLDALDAAVRDTLAGNKSAADSLSAVAEAWRQITAELGQEAQRKAYRQSLGLAP